MAAPPTPDPTGGTDVNPFVYVVDLLASWVNDALDLDWWDGDE